MIATPALAWVLTIAFVLAGAYALLRWSATMTGPLPRAQRTTELAHLLMSVSMLLMTWTWFGSAGQVVQVALFALFTGYFAVRAVAARRGRTHACTGGTAHALAAGAMVWMLVSMPLIMATPVTGSGGGHAGHAGHGGGHAGHAGHGGGATTDTAIPPGAPAGWAVGLTLAVCVALLVASGYWAMRAVRRGPVPSAAGTVAPSAGTVALSAGTVAPEAAGSPSPAGLATLERTAARPTATAVSPLIGPRSDAGCHAAMCLGMAAMLLAMVAGW